MQTATVDFVSRADYLGAPPLAMAFLDRLVDRAVLLKIKRKILPRQPIHPKFAPAQD